MDCFAEPVIGRAFARLVGSHDRGEAGPQNSCAIFASIPSSAVAVGRPEQFVQPRLVLGGDELFCARQHGAALVGQHQDVRAAVVGGAHPRAEIAAFQVVEHRHEIRPQDAERVGDLGLVAAGILVQQQQHRKLRRRQLQRRDAAQKVLEHLQLRALQRHSRAVRTIRRAAARGFFRRALGGRLAQRAGRLDGVGGGLGNGHRSRLAIPIDSRSRSAAGP